MKILLYGINYSPELTGIGKYSGELAPWLASRGHDVHMVTAPPYYPEWRVAEGFSSWRYRSQVEEGVTVYRCPLYVPRQATAIKRLLHLASFAFSSFFVMLRHLAWKPDVVVLVVPTLFCAFSTLLVSRLTGAKAVIHVQDYEVDALFGLSMAGGGRLRSLVYRLERWVLRRFDTVSTISPGMMKRAVAKGVDEGKVMFFPNWSGANHFKQVGRDDSLLATLGVPDGARVVLYSGNIGEKQGLEFVLDAAHQFSVKESGQLSVGSGQWAGKEEALCFLIVGEGAGKARLLVRVRELGLTNVVFAPLQPFEVLPTLLASADCHLVVQRRGAADAVLPSKLTNILAVGGNAVITAEPDTSLGELCVEFPGIAVAVEPESATALVAGITQALTLPKPNPVALAYAAEFLDKEQILLRFERGLFELRGAELGCR